MLSNKYSTATNNFGKQCEQQLIDINNIANSRERENKQQHKTKSIQLVTVSMETVRMAKSRPRENQSKASDYFPQDYLDNIINPSMYIPSLIYNSSSVFSGIFVRPYDSV